MPNKVAALWSQSAQTTLDTAKSLRDSDDARSCISRIYYAAYQAATSVSITHNDLLNFRRGGTTRRTSSSRTCCKTTLTSARPPDAQRLVSCACCETSAKMPTTAPAEL